MEDSRGAGSAGGTPLLLSPAGLRFTEDIYEFTLSKNMNLNTWS